MIETISEEEEKSREISQDKKAESTNRLTFGDEQRAKKEGNFDDGFE